MIEFPICDNDCDDCREMILNFDCSPDNPNERWANLVDTISAQPPDKGNSGKKAQEASR